MVVRRLKRDIVNADGTPRFPRASHRGDRRSSTPTSEREVHGLLDRVRRPAPQRDATAGAAARPPTWSRCCSRSGCSPSPAAFAAHRRGLPRARSTSAGRPARTAATTDAEWLDDFCDDTPTCDDDETRRGRGRRRSTAATRLQPERRPARGARPAAADASAGRWRHEAAARRQGRRELITYLEAVCRPGRRAGRTSGSSSSPSTATPSAGSPSCSRQDGLGGDRLAHAARRHGHRRARAAHGRRSRPTPTEHPVRILLATDAASEGIDLQRHCHRLVNYDIPFNPNRLEQRNGRVDRYGQQHDPEIRHFVGSRLGADAVDSSRPTWSSSSRVAREGRHDARRPRLGQRRASPTPFSAAMLGRARHLDDVDDGRAAERRAHGCCTVEHERPRAGAPAARAARRDASPSCGITPADVQAGRGHRARPGPPAAAAARTSTTALGDGCSTSRRSPAPGSAPPRAAEKLETADRPRQRPSPSTRPSPRAGDDVVLAHLNHPLVAMSTAAAARRGVAARTPAAPGHRRASATTLALGGRARRRLLPLRARRRRRRPPARGGPARRRLDAPSAAASAGSENCARSRALLARALTHGARRRRTSSPAGRALAAVRDGAARRDRLRADERAGASLERSSPSAREAEQERIAAGSTVRGTPCAASSPRRTTDAEQSRCSAARGRKTATSSTQYRRDRDPGPSASTSSPRSGSASCRRRARYADPEPHRFPVAVVVRRSATGGHPMTRHAPRAPPERRPRPPAPDWLDLVEVVRPVPDPAGAASRPGRRSNRSTRTQRDALRAPTAPGATTPPRRERAGSSTSWRDLLGWGDDLPSGPHLPT